MERTGGVGCDFKRINWFNDCVNECGLSDLDSLGPKFTWKGPLMPGCSRLYERLDRAFVNNHFLAEMDECVLKVLPRTLFSDHNPLLLSLSVQQVAQIPISICKEVEKIQMNFIWGHSESQYGFHPIGWNQLLWSKDPRGVLDLKDFPFSMRLMEPS
ncbi:hypothetical protein QN277_008858 [Acacia crassicarpa]|uniref:Uncharacterized protein n=1 Tax=Acacia crassicarpa TaxID=499986 RepID=A0AAE1ISH4_9FABA|nr:hypothetical protein QN277_008858 [Acacia crassicarpa]